ncbi:hypothetical protein ACH3XW_17915 [Acanthocheilonema viteae]
MDGSLAQIDILKMEWARGKKEQNSKTIMYYDKRTAPPPPLSPSPSSLSSSSSSIITTIEKCLFERQGKEMNVVDAPF